MPLSKPQPRKHLHSREIRCRGYQRDDGLWDIEASLVDTKTYTFDNHDRDHVAAGEPLHDMWIRLTLDDDMTVQKAEAVTDHGPFLICGDITKKFAEIEGLRIGPGWRREVNKRLGGAMGCTHLADLLLGPLAVAALHTVDPGRRMRGQGRETTEKPALLDSCHAFATDSPVVKRRWPEFYKGK